MDRVIYYGIMFIIAVLTYLFGRYIMPHIPEDKMAFLEYWAEKFIAWAEDKMRDSTGREKMEAVIAKLQEKAAEKGLNLTDDDIYALAQLSYDQIKDLIKKHDDG